MNDHLEQTLKLNRMRTSYFQIHHGNISQIERNDSNFSRKINSEAILNKRMHNEEHFTFNKPDDTLLVDSITSSVSLKS